MAISTSPYDWVRAIKPNLKQLDAVPLTGTAPPFPWDELTNRLAAIFNNETLKIEPAEVMWRAKEALFEGLEEAPKSFQFTLPSLNGKAWWLIPNEQLLKLERKLFLSPDQRLELLDDSVTAAFTQFLMCEIQFQIEQLPTSSILSPILNSVSTLPNEDALCLDVAIAIDEQKLSSRLVISSELRHSWVDYHLQHYEQSALSEELAKIIDIRLHIEVGKTELTFQEWSTVGLGDCILMDHCALNPETLDGKVVLTIDRRETLRAKLKDGKLKILELPLFHEVDAPMDNENEYDEDENEDADIFDDLDMPEDEDEEEESDISDEDTVEEEEEEDFLTEFEDEYLEEKEHTDAHAEGEAEEEGASGVEVEEGKKGVEEEVVVASEAEEKGPITPGEIPLTLVVEAGCIQMTMEQMLQLEPGNLLELNIRPESGVDLTINGKIVGKGELIRLGETLGVRILKLGRQKMP